jgi:hypothetical protein
MLDILLCNHADPGKGAEALIGLLGDRPLLSPTFVTSIAKGAFTLKGLYSDYFRAVACSYSRDIASRIRARR